MSFLRTFGTIAGLGMIAGMRATSAPTVISSYLAEHPDPAIKDSPLRWLNSPAVAWTIRLMALGELVGDKLPGIPARTESVGIAGRFLSGSAAGAAVATMDHRPVLPAALTGGTLAIISAHLFSRARVQAAENSRLPGVVWAVAEDTLVIGCGLVLRRALENRPGLSS